MAKEYTQEQYWEIYKKLPEEIREVGFSESTTRNIRRTCLKYNLTEEQVSEITKYVGQVLFGVLSLDEFQKVLEKDLGSKTAKGVFQEIDHSIFSLVKDLIGPAPTGEAPSGIPEAKKPEIKPSPQKKDVYREPVE